jgi:hypothetical protein
MIKLLFNEIADKIVRENFKKLDDFVRDNVFRKGNFLFMELRLASDAAHAYPATVSVRHSLGSKPKDVIITALSPDTVTVTPKFDSFTRTHLYFTISAAVTLRGYVGRYGES